MLSLQRSTSRKTEPALNGPLLPLSVRFVKDGDVIPEELKSVNYELTSKQFHQAHDIPVESIVELR